MNDAEEQFAARLAEDLERVLGVGFAIDDLELTNEDGRASVRATLLMEGASRRSRSRAPTSSPSIGR